MLQHTLYYRKFQFPLQPVPYILKTQIFWTRRDSLWINWTCFLKFPKHFWDRKRNGTFDRHLCMHDDAVCTIAYKKCEWIKGDSSCRTGKFHPVKERKTLVFLSIEEDVNQDFLHKKKKKTSSLKLSTKENVSLGNWVTQLAFTMAHTTEERILGSTYNKCLWIPSFY